MRQSLPRAGHVPTRAGHVPTFLKSFCTVLERGPSADRSVLVPFFPIIPFSFYSVLFHSVPFRSVLSLRMIITFCSVIGVLSQRTVPSQRSVYSQEENRWRRGEGLGGGYFRGVKSLV